MSEEDISIKNSSRKVFHILLILFSAILTFNADSLLTDNDYVYQHNQIENSIEIEFPQQTNQLSLATKRLVVATKEYKSQLPFQLPTFLLKNTFSKKNIISPPQKDIIHLYCILLI